MTTLQRDDSHKPRYHPYSCCFCLTQFCSRHSVVRNVHPPSQPTFLISVLLMESYPAFSHAAPVGISQFCLNGKRLSAGDLFSLAGNRTLLNTFIAFVISFGNLCYILAIKTGKVKPFSYCSAFSCSSRRPSSLIRSIISM